MKNCSKICVRLRVVYKVLGVADPPPPSMLKSISLFRSVSQGATWLRTEIFKHLLGGFCTNVHDSQGMNPNDSVTL